VASGADLLFSESCIQLKIPLRVLLPIPKDKFQKDFDVATWTRAEQVMAQAISVEVTGNDELREERYYECGIQTVQQSQIMLALWDGRPSRGTGGTEEIVTFAKKMGRPVVWLHSVTGDAVVYNQQAMQGLQMDPELDFLNNLPDAGVTLGTDSSVNKATAWLRKIDENASRLAPQVRRLASIPIMYTAAAAFFSGAGLHMRHAQTWLAVGTALGITAAGLPFALRLPHRQMLWARTRTAAEVCRSVLALWNTPLAYEVIGLEIVPELTGMLMSLNLLKALDASRRDVSINEFKEQYCKDRVSDQMKYFSKNAIQSASVARRYRIVSWICTGLAIVTAACVFIIGAKFKDTHIFNERDGLSVAVSALFQLATVAGALVIVNDCDRRQRRYQQLHSWLQQWEAELDALRTWPTVLQVTGRIERALLVELLEWKSLVRNVTLPRK
jgi:hypothetical protein